MPFNHISVFELNFSPVGTNDEFLTIFGDDKIGPSNIITLLNTFLQVLNRVSINNFSDGKNLGHKLRNNDLTRMQIGIR